MHTYQNHEHRRSVRYLPRTLIKHWANEKDISPVWGEWLDGSLMHCDVTGFTAMSESLGKFGKEGAEIMAGILNQFFERMLGIANEWNGIQMKFGGDAMLLYFTDEEHAERAAACGLQMQTAMDEFSNVKVNEDIYKLRMRIGIHSGRFYGVSTGQADGLLHYLIIGNDVNKAADVEPMAEPDQVVVSEETKCLLSPSCKLVKTKHAGIWWVKKTGKPAVDNLITNVQNIPDGVLRRYLMPPIADGMTTGILGEHRRVTVVFINLFGLSELLENQGDDTALNQANQYMKNLFNMLSRYSGFLITSDVCEHGDKILLAFGAPVSLDNQEENAMRFAIELQKYLSASDLELTQSIGVNSGFVFSGEVGSVKRREYTTIGDTTNLAARLMSAADRGKIIVSASTAERTGKTFKLTYLDPIRVKGKSEPINICVLDGLVESDTETEDSTNNIQFVGRIHEMEQMNIIANDVKNNQCQWVFIHGEPGIGKTHIANTFMAGLKQQNWFCMLGICQSYNLHSAFSVWIYPLRKLFNLDFTETDEASWNKIYRHIETNIPEQVDFAPLIADILSIPCESNDITDSLDPKSLRERRIEIITQMIISAAADSPLLIMFDNAQWIDSSSAEVLNNLLSMKYELPVYVCLVSRSESPPNELETLTPDLSMKLTELSNRESRELISNCNTMSEEDINNILSRAKGNPLFLKELCLSTSINHDLLPESIVDVIMVRLDQMDDDRKSLLRNAAVIGQVFDLKTLDSVILNSPGLTNEAG